MRNITAALVLVVTINSGCSTFSGFFGRKTPHEKYAKKLDDEDLEYTPAGRQWLAASKAALGDALKIELPYRLYGNFRSDKSRALGLEFKAKKGEQVNVAIIKKNNTPIALFADVFKQLGTETVLVYAADTLKSQFAVDIEETGSYILRLQPKLFRSGEFSLAVSVGPSLGFPVSGSKAKIGSFWGASRGGGKRSHEGIDIFAPKRTPVVAAADGIVTGVLEGGLGGKVVWLKLPAKNITLYYAHLENQLVHVGQELKKGEILGLVGNTGNAKHTASHLHFGIYTSNGPIDPFPFVNPSIKLAPNVPNKNLSNFIRLTRTLKLSNESDAIKANTLLVPVAVHSKGYIAELPNGKILQVPFTSVQSSTQPIKNVEAIVTSVNKDSSDKKRRM